ncbi:MAG: hydrolase [Acetobacteraceae bacterium]|nr:hydrolase [Acetobacteraceae bacterium]
MSTTRAPKQKAPALTCDSHFHIFGPYDKFPLSATRGYNPPVALVSDYLAMAESLGIERMVVVQASVSGTDNAVTLDAVRQFGQHRARAVAVIDDSFTDATLKQMHDAGTRGVRFNVSTGNGTPIDQLEPIARRIAPLGWHIQVYIEGESLATMGPTLAKVPVPIVIDHCGGVRAGLGLEHPQFQDLLRLLDSGNAFIKTCSYRVSSAGKPWADSAPNVKALVARFPERCIWGTDWPHPQMNPSPEAGLLLDQFFEWVPDAATRQRILVDTAAKLYGF